MKKSIGWGLAAAIVVAAALGAWWKQRSPADAATEAVEPVAAIRSELPRVQRIAETLDALGDVETGQLTGLSFARAGQLTRMSALPGDRVVRGTVLATLTPDPASRQAYQAAADAVGLARRESERQSQLLAAHLSIRSQADAAAKALLDAQGALQALDEQDGNRRTSELVAPFDGIVTVVSATQGDRVQAGAPVLQVGRTDVLRVRVGIEPSERARVHVGTRLTVRPVASPGTEARPVELVLAQVQDTVDPKTQLVDAVAMLGPAAAASFTPGMKVRAELQVGEVSGVAVPRNAVLSDEKGDYVFQVVSGKARRVAVTRRLDDGTLAAVAGLDDLKLPVVVEGNYELDDGMAVRNAAK